MDLTLFGGRRFQVFVSSTFVDLIKERQQVIQSLIMTNCFPIAMEHFPASYDKQWGYIQPLIAQSDFFICLIGGRYGSCADDGVGYTQREFEYAVSCNIPILVFYHANPDKLTGDHIEPTDDGKRKLAAFVQIAKKDRLCSAWNTAEQLPGLVIPSFIEMALKCDRPGWRYRAEKTKEFLELELAHSKLQTEVQELNANIADLQTENKKAPDATFLDYDDAAHTVAKSLAVVASNCDRRQETLKVRLLGICLHKSFPTLKKFIETLENPIRVEVRLAILRENSPIFHGLNDRWKKLYGIFHDDLNELLTFLRLGKAKAKVSIKLSQYDHMPNWHGILINYEHLFLGHCLWHEDGTFTAGQNPYDHYLQSHSVTHDRKIKQYVKWFDFCRRTDPSPKLDQLLVDTAAPQTS